MLTFDVDAVDACPCVKWHDTRNQCAKAVDSSALVGKRRTRRLEGTHKGVQDELALASTLNASM